MNAYFLKTGTISSVASAMLLLFFAYIAPDALAMGKTIDDTVVLVQSGDKTFEFTVETARTDEQRARGLMYRRELEDDMGMIFLFLPERSVNFTMRNTFISLDLIFIRRDGTIESIISKTPPLEPGPFSSKGNVRAVLEIKGGRAQALGIRPGDRVQHIFLDNLEE